ncbi:MAG: hypothetical protein ACRD0L_01150 [Acidimicrobiales bacterium]
MTGAGPELSSLATALADLTRRITAIAETYARAEREDLAAELYAAERALVGAHRRLTRVADAPGRQGSGPGHTDGAP